MQIHLSKNRVAFTLCVLTAAVAFLMPSRLTAQSVWSKIKQQAKQAAQHPQQQSTHSVNPTYQPAAASAVSTGSEPDGSCCTAAAMKTMAAQAGSVDIVGIRLGMTPKQAIAAIKAHNPALTVYAVNMRLTHPGARNFVEVPHYIVATDSPPGTQRKMVGMEAIILEFTTPPNSPVVAMASRYTNFAPALASNLVEGLDKKYGPEYPRVGERSWLYDSSVNR